MKQDRGNRRLPLVSLWIWLCMVFALVASGTTVHAIELGESGINVHLPDRGWKVDTREDAAIEVWHFRAKAWDPLPKESGMIAVTISFLSYDPLKGQSLEAMQQKSADSVAGTLLKQVTRRSPFAMQSGRFEVAGEDVDGHIDLRAGDLLPVSGRSVIIRTPDGLALISAFSLLPSNQDPFAALFGPTGFVSFEGPGSELFTRSAAATPEETLRAPRDNQPPTDESHDTKDSAETEMQDLLKEMQKGFE